MEVEKWLTVFKKIHLGLQERWKGKEKERGEGREGGTEEGGRERDAELGEGMAEYSSF